MNRLLLFSLIFFLSSIVTNAQKTDCPKVKVKTSSQKIGVGEVAEFKVEIVPGKAKKEIVIEWEIEGGKIISGDGTDTIQVMPDDQMAGNIDVSVSTGGPGECSSWFGRIVCVGEPPAPELTAVIGQSGGADFETVLNRFKNLLAENPTATGYIVNYGPPTAVAAREREIRESIRIRHIDPSKTVLVNGGLERNGDHSLQTRFWIVPLCADSSKID